VGVSSGLSISAWRRSLEQRTPGNPTVAYLSATAWRARQEIPAQESDMAKIKVKNPIVELTAR
jgi:hypothetical protein